MLVMSAICDVSIKYVYFFFIFQNNDLRALWNEKAFSIAMFWLVNMTHTFWKQQVQEGSAKVL